MFLGTSTVPMVVARGRWWWWCDEEERDNVAVFCRSGESLMRVSGANVSVPLEAVDDPMEGTAVSPSTKGAVGNAGDAFSDDTSVRDDPGELSLDVAMDPVVADIDTGARALADSLCVLDATA